MQPTHRIKLSNKAAYLHNIHAFIQQERWANCDYWYEAIFKDGSYYIPELDNRFDDDEIIGYEVLFTPVKRYENFLDMLTKIGDNSESSESGHT